MLNPVGRPLLDTAHHLFTKFCVFNGARRLRRKSKNGFFVSRRFFQSYTLGYDSLEQFWPEHSLNLVEHFSRQRGPLVVQRDQHSYDLQVGIGPSFHFLDRIEQIVGALEGKVRRLNWYQYITGGNQR